MRCSSTAFWFRRIDKSHRLNLGMNSSTTGKLHIFNQPTYSLWSGGNIVTQMLQITDTSWNNSIDASSMCIISSGRGRAWLTPTSFFFLALRKFCLSLLVLCYAIYFPKSVGYSWFTLFIFPSSIQYVLSEIL